MINEVKKRINKLKKKFIKKIKISNLLNRNRFSMVEVILLLLITLVVGVIIGYSINFKFKNIVNNSESILLTSVYDNILHNYYKEVSSDELDKAAISGIIDYLDDENTIELYDSSYDDLREQVNGYFCGIGVSVVLENNNLVVIKVIENSISEKVGIKIDDIIYEVDGIKVNDSNFIDLIKGTCGTDLKLSVKRGKEKLEFNLIREAVSINSVTSQYFDVNGRNVGYIDIDVFSLDSYKLFLKNLERLENNNIKSLIIDLRNNPGGVVSSARKIMNLFFEKNTILYSFKSRNKETIVKDDSKESRNYKIVILMNENTASASEMFITAFNDNYKDVTLIGKSTYGKNTIQTNLTLTENYGIKYTSSEWFTSKDLSVKEFGVQPDITIDNSGTSFYEDNQLQAAINLLK